MLEPISCEECVGTRKYKSPKGPDGPDAIRQREANFQFQK